MHCSEKQVGAPAPFGSHFALLITTVCNLFCPSHKVVIPQTEQISPQAVATCRVEESTSLCRLSERDVSHRNCKG